MVKIIQNGSYICHEIYDDFKKDYLNTDHTRKSLIEKYGLRDGEYRILVRWVKSETGYDKRGTHSKKRKLWDVSKVYHNQKNHLEHKPSKCFYLKYENKLVKIGGFKDPISCEIIYDLIKESI